MYALSITEICERALRRIGAFTIHDTGANPAEMGEARYWLDMIIGNVAANRRAFWLINNEYKFDLRAGVGQYDVLEELGQAGPPDGIMFPVGARILTIPTGTDPTPVDTLPPTDDFKLLRLVEWDEIAEKEKQGIPEAGYFSRHDRPLLSVHYVPNDNATYQIQLRVQEYSPDFVSGSPTDKVSTVRESWNLFVVTELAHRIGAGPVRRLPDAEVRELRNEAKDLRDGLFQYEDEEHADEPRRVSYHGSI